MVSIRERNSCDKILAFMILLVSLTCSCSIGRVYIGSEIKYDPRDKIHIGTTTKSDILGIYGPPSRIQRQYDGDIFVYLYLRKNSSQFFIAVPYPIRLSLFRYAKTQQKNDSLAILFDKDGVVKNYGFQRGTSELAQF
jgi:outer membrane protein assembly factor BamE (lipoprotein component of BamABCDE complex)